MTEFESEKKNKIEFHEATQAKQIKKKNKIKSDKSLYDVFTENKSAFYGIIFYAAGLLCGAFIYKKCQTDALNELISASASGNFTNLFINNLGFYFLAFAAAVVLGLCGISVYKSCCACNRPLRRNQCCILLYKLRRKRLRIFAFDDCAVYLLVFNRYNFYDFAELRFKQKNI